MARPKDKRRLAPEASVPVPQRPDLLRGWRWVAAVILVVLVFYWIPLTDPNTSPRYDAIDVHYSAQKYFADHLRQGELPSWTPYIFSGFPFLADPQVGAWYPPNWPFFVAGITPKAIEAELALHAAIALAGAYLLIFSITGERFPAFVGALFYGLSGFFADHSQHVGMFSTASWAPWLLWSYRRALSGGAVRWIGAGGLIGGCLVLAGHFQTALYSFCALCLLAAAELVLKPRHWKRSIVVVAGIVALAAGISVIQSLPGLELASYSERATVDYGSSSERVLQLESLTNLVWPNATGSRAPGYYLYSGLLLVPLALLGLTDVRLRWAGGILAVGSIWYMLGPAFGLFRLGALVPGLHSVRAPVHGWFVATLGLALLSAGGVGWLLRRFNGKLAYKVALVVAVSADLFFWNSYTNEGAYARYSFERLYGTNENLARQNIATSQEARTRYHAPRGLVLFGPLNHPLDIHLEATYGYNPLELLRYRQYFDAVSANAKLLAGLNVSRTVDPELRAAAIPFSPTLPRAYFARSIAVVEDDADALARLATLDPAAETVAAEPVDPALANPNAQVRIVSSSESSYVLSYDLAAESLLRMSVPYFPGWTAEADGQKLRIIRVDHAFIGVVVPAGQGELRLEYRSTYFAWGAALSLLTLLAALVLIGGRGLRLAALPSNQADEPQG
ncbi:MAG: YfhO family protein [Acidobacteria bacterium]|nr:YfhO family protein [Acidobacteriota bacterium]